MLEEKNATSIVNSIEVRKEDEGTTTAEVVNAQPAEAEGITSSCFTETSNVASGDKQAVSDAASFGTQTINFNSSFLEFALSSVKETFPDFMKNGISEFKKDFRCKHPDLASKDDKQLERNSEYAKEKKAYLRKMQPDLADFSECLNKCYDTSINKSGRVNSAVLKKGLFLMHLYLYGLHEKDRLKTFVSKDEDCLEITTRNDYCSCRVMGTVNKRSKTTIELSLGKDVSFSTFNALFYNNMCELYYEYTGDAGNSDETHKRIICWIMVTYLRAAVPYKENTTLAHCLRYIRQLLYEEGFL